MAVDFCDYFWGEEHNGWNVLYQNMRLGQTATKELTDFFKERWSIDETYAKSLNKLAQRVGGGQGAVSGNVIGNVERWGSFAPVFGVLRAACEQLASVHLSVVAKLQDLVKELNKYQEQMHRKHKQVKDEESHTEDLVKTIQTTSVMAQKAKENYSQRCQDLERVRREGASPKDLEKAEAKLRKSYDEYKHLLDKYNNIREDFEKCMTVSCKRFQEVEDQHLTRLLHSVREFVRVLGSSSEAVAQIQHDMHRHFSRHSVLSLLDAFALNKYTGLEKPTVMVFEDCGSLGLDQQSPELGANARAQSSSSLQQPDQQSSKSSAEEIPSAGGGGGGVLAGGFLRSRRDRKKEKKNKKKKDAADTASNREDRSDNEASEEARTTELVCVRPEESEVPDGGANLLGGDPMLPAEGNNASVSSSGSGAVAGVDEEGYSLKPHPTSQPQLSSSDSDSDDDYERPIHVSIKPISNGAPPAAASVDQLRATIQGMALGAPLPANRRVGALSSEGHEGGLRRSSSATNASRSSSADLLGLNLTFGGPDAPAGGAGAASSPLTAPAHLSQESTLNSSPAPPAGGGATSPPPTLPPRGSTPTPTSTIPRPLSRRNFDARGRSNSPALPSSALSRAESASSLDWRSPPAGGGPVGSSRGPSPLTLGFSDTIPLAIAFQELCHVYFRGTDEARCQVKVTGEVMVSFPAGIVSVLTTRPQPSPPLSFTLTNTGLCDQVLPNTQLIERCSVEEHSYNFLMPALTALLRQQVDSNPSASYFNVDIVKYQVSSLRGAQCTPLQLVSYWKCTDDVTELRVDYRYNPAAALPSPQPLLNVTLSTVVDGAVKTMHSRPQGQWLKEQQKAVWKLPELSPQSAQQSGSLRAKFEVAVGPSTPSTVSAMFTCEAATITGMDFVLNGPGYRLSLVKKRFVSGKYICDADAVLRLRYGAGAS